MKFSLNPNTESALHLNRTLQASKKKVYEAWTQPATLMKWWGFDDLKLGKAEGQPDVGEPFRLELRGKTGSRNLIGEFREVRPAELLVQSCRWEDLGEDAETLLTVEFRERGKATEISLTQENLPTPAARQEFTKLWLGCFDRLARFL